MTCWKNPVVLALLAAVAGLRCDGGGGTDATRDADGEVLDEAGADVGADAGGDAERDGTDDALPPEDAGEDADGGGSPRPLAIDPVDPHRFVQGDRPVYVAGYYPSIATVVGADNADPGYYRALIDRLALHGVNYVRQVFTMGQPFGASRVPYERTGPGPAADGLPRFDLTRFDESFFAYWREVIGYANERGVFVQLTLLDTWHNKEEVTEDVGGGTLWGMAWDFYDGANNVNGIDTADVRQWTDPTHPAFAHQQALVRHAVETLGDLPNIVWEICNENYYGAEWELLLADELTRRERELGLAEHLVMPRDLPNHDGAGGKQNDPDTTHRELLENFALGRPLIADNDGGGDADPDGRRRKAWAALTAGGHIDYFHFALHESEMLGSTDAEEGLRYVGLLRTFLDELRVELRGLAPADGLVSAGWCLGRAGERYVVYLPRGGTTRLADLPATYTATWFDPRDGSRRPAAGGPEFAAPDDGDWVLFVEVAAP